MPLYALDGVAPEFDSDAWWIADNATVLGRVRVGHRVSIWFQAVVRGDNEPITLMADSNVQDGAILHTDPGAPLTIGPRVTVGHRAMLHGCTIQEGSLVGIGATILNHTQVGKHCIIGAHTLIPEGKQIPDRSLVLGSPGKVVRSLTDAEVQRLEASAAHYVWNHQRYQAQLKRL